MKTVQFLAVVLTALVLVPSGAHLFELPNKINLAESDDFIMQSIYRGWSLFGIALILAPAANFALTMSLRGRGRTCVGTGKCPMPSTLPPLARE